MRLKHPRHYPPHAERIVTRVTPPTLSTKEHQEYINTTELSQNNNLVKVSRVCYTHPSDKMDKYQVSDFCLENLQAIGAPLHTTHLSNGNSMSTIDKATRMMSQLDSLEVQSQTTE